MADSNIFKRISLCFIIFALILNIEAEVLNEVKVSSNLINISKNEQKMDKVTSTNMAVTGKKSTAEEPVKSSNQDEEDTSDDAKELPSLIAELHSSKTINLEKAIRLFHLI